ncbi:MAG TPA: putative Ig domain-containing protein, partial [Pseudomonadales bacterium]|nr:putative Ig domain-containing protein [Pseudomonadales bacterium]
MKSALKIFCITLGMAASWLPMSAHATYATESCGACHTPDPTSSSLRNPANNAVYTLFDATTAYPIRVAKNPNYLEYMISLGDMTATLSAATVLADANEVATNSGIAPSITSAAPSSGTINSAYSHTVVATGKPTLVGNPGMGRGIQLKADGTCTNITGTYASNFCYWAATPQAFTVSSGALPTGLSLNGSSGVISGTPTVAGTYTGVITANNLVGTATQSFSITINKLTQSITFGAQTGQTYSAGGTFSISPTASASSGLAVTYSSTTTGVCTVSGTTVTIVTAGTCTIAANQAGNGTYSAASQVTQNVAIAKATQTITFGAQTSPRTYSSGGT